MQISVKIEAENSKKNFFMLFQRKNTSSLFLERQNNISVYTKDHRQSILFQLI